MLGLPRTGCRELLFWPESIRNNHEVILWFIILNRKGVSMNTCSQCGSEIDNSQYRFCPTCGKPIDVISIPANENVQLKSPNSSVTNKTKLIVGLASVGFLLLIVLSQLYRPPAQSPNLNSYSDQISSQRTGIVETGFYLNIGLTAGELIHKLGEPTTIDHTLYLYDDPYSRKMYGFKNKRVYDATYIIEEVPPNDVPNVVSGLMTNLQNNNFWRISDFGNMKRYRNGKFELSIFARENDDGSYNVCLMAFRH